VNIFKKQWKEYYLKHINPEIIEMYPHIATDCDGMVFGFDVPIVAFHGDGVWGVDGECRNTPIFNCKYVGDAPPLVTHWDSYVDFSEVKNENRK